MSKEKFNTWRDLGKNKIVKPKPEMLIDRRKFLKGGLLGAAVLSLYQLGEFIDKLNWTTKEEALEEGRKADDEEKLREAFLKVQERARAKEQEQLKERELVEGTICEQLVKYKKVDMKKAKEAIYQKWYDMYAPGGVEHAGLLKSLNNMQPWLAEMKEVFAQEGVDEKIIYLSIPESGFNFYATSPAKAEGPFQFTKATAEGFGLICNNEIDERLDPIKSCRAAAQYLKQLLVRAEGDLKLALAEYNGSYAKKYRILRAREESRISYDDYLEYREQNINDYIKENEEQGYYSHEVMTGETLSSIASKYRIEVSEIEQLNQEFIPSDGDLLEEGNLFKLPLKESVMLRKLASSLENLNYPEKFLAIWQVIEDCNLRKKYPALTTSYKSIFLPEEKRFFLKIKVKQGDNLSAIANRLRNKINKTFSNSAPKTKTVINLLQKQNRLRKVTDIHPGQELKLEINLRKLITLAQIAENSGLKLKEIRQLNPAVKEWKANLPPGFEVRLRK